jgi:hypothetical protein
MAGLLERVLRFASMSFRSRPINSYSDGRRDVVIGCFTAYEFDRIRLWVNSLDRSGFSGLKLVLCGEAELATLRELERRNYRIMRFEMNDKEDPYSIFRDRYFQTYNVLRRICEEPYRFVIAPDMKDVIFQTNPSNWLEENAGTAHLIAGSECLTHESEDWAREMMLEMFGPEIYELIKEKIIYNAGTMAGRPRVFSQFCLQVFLMLGKKSQTPRSMGLYPDQAAANLLLHFTQFLDLTRFSTAESGWTCTAGTMADPRVISQYRPKLTEPEPRLNDFQVVTSLGIPYCLVHQYDRVPSWLDQLRQRYW